MFTIYDLLKKTLIVFAIASYLSPSYAIPPPETIAMLGGSLISPGLFIFGIFSLIFQYVWIKSKLYLVWRSHSIKCLWFIIIILLFMVPFTNLYDVLSENRAITPTTIQSWQKNDHPYSIIDLRDEKSYEKVHVLDSLNAPQGNNLAQYINTRPQQNIVLICELGFQSRFLTITEPDKTILRRLLSENRLYYISGGIKKLLKDADNNPLPLVINIPKKYGMALLKKQLFTSLSVTDSQQLTEYAHLLDRKTVPLIKSTESHDELARQINKRYKQTQIYFIENEKLQVFPLSQLIVFLFLIAMLLYVTRIKEVFLSIIQKPSRSFRWKTLLISLCTSILVVQLSYSFSIPFDMYLAQMVPMLPMEPFYLCSVYSLLGFILLAHATYTSKVRLKIIHNTFSTHFLASNNEGSKHYPSVQSILFVSLGLYITYKLSIQLWSLYCTTLFLSLPFVIDALIYVLVRNFKNTPRCIRNTLKRSCFSCTSNNHPFVHINTQTSSIAIIQLTLGTEVLNLGLFTGKINEATSPHSALFKKLKINEQIIASYARISRRLLLLFQQDLQITLDKDNNIIALYLNNNGLSSQSITRTTLLKQQLLLATTSGAEHQMTSLPFQDVFTHPTPLALDIIKQRWDKKGGCIKALRRLGLLARYNEQAREQFFACSNRIYLDKAYEQSLFTTHKILEWYRKKLLSLKINLALGCVVPDYYTLMLPRIKTRHIQLTQYGEQVVSSKRLKRIVSRALRNLCRESAFWQCYGSVLHQEAFLQLEQEAANTGVSLSSLISDATSTQTSIPSYYELTPSLNGKEPQKAQTIFAHTERIRTELRQLQLQEWHLINILLTRLSTQLQLSRSLVYLTINDLRALPRSKEKLNRLIEQRYQAWNLQNEYLLPKSFSLHELELLRPNTQSEETQLSSSTSFRVSGNQRSICGIAVSMKPNRSLNTLPKNSFLIADNVTAEQVVACQHIRGIILRQGGYLSHAAIIAREKNVPMLVQYPVDTIPDGTPIIVHTSNQIDVLSNRLSSWLFLENITAQIKPGNKAYRLALLNRDGFAVPPSIVLPHQAVKHINDLLSSADPHHLWQEYRTELKQILTCLTTDNSSIIVRSSSTVEDGTEHSYAGIFYSQPHINNIDELIAAIKTAWQTMHDKKSIIQKYNRDDSLKLNLLIQQYIKGKAGGVLFTQSTQPGLMHLELTAQGIEGVTEGNSSLNSLHIDATGQVIQAIGDQHILSTQEYQALYQLGQQLETLFEAPQDIEWVIMDQKIYIIQSRNIALKNAVESTVNDFLLTKRCSET